MKSRYGAKTQPLATLPDLSPLKEVVARYGLTPKRSRGQHFLFDSNITGRIAAAAGDLKKVVVYEVGPGPGGLTRALLGAGARKVVAVETDLRCVEALRELVQVSSGRLRVLADNALTLNEARYVPDGSKIVANLPYNISSALLLKWLQTPRRWNSMTLMFQKEVAQRLAASPGGRDYGRLSVITQWVCTTKTLFDVAPGSFVPAPKVTSTVVSVVPRLEGPVAPARREYLEKILASAFGQRRKMLRTSLKTTGVRAEEILEVAGVSPTARAEEISVLEFCSLARAYQDLVGGRY